MKIQVRKSVFETNSSSSHSLTLATENLRAIPFPAAVLKAGVLEVAKGEYGWEWGRLYRPDLKIGYLVTQLFQDDIPDGSPQSVTAELRKENSRFDQLWEVVKAHTGVDIQVCPGSSGYIDHDSVGNAMEVFGKGNDALCDFLFANSYIETGNDNSSPPPNIQVDWGATYEPYYAPRIRTPAKDAVTVQLGMTEFWAPQFFTDKGVPFTPAQQPLLDAICAQGVVTAVDWVCKGKYDRFEYHEQDASTYGTLAGAGLFFVQHVRISAKYTPTDSFEDRDKATLTMSVPLALKEQLDALAPPPPPKKATKKAAPKPAGAPKPSAAKKAPVVKPTAVAKKPAPVKRASKRDSA